MLCNMHLYIYLTQLPYQVNPLYRHHHCWSWTLYQFYINNRSIITQSIYELISRLINPMLT